MIRYATINDLPYLVHSTTQLTRFIQQCGANPYSDSLPTDETLIKRYVGEFVDHPDAIALIAEEDGMPVGCLLGNIQASNMPFCIASPVGFIAIAWVEADFRKQGCMHRLLDQAEVWYTSKRITLMELSYMAQNQLAESAWQKMGFEAFRVFAYKEIS
jgi:GNAT superfamily N-acetyltransferase